MDNGASSYRRFREEDDESGLAEIIRDYKDGLILYIYSIVGDLYIAEDLAMDTFTLLGIKKPKDNQKSSFKTWLYTIGRNLAIDHLRKESKFKELPMDNFPFLSDEKDDFVISYIRSEQNIALHNSLRNLKPEYRQIIWLIYFEEMSIKESSIIMRKSVHATEVLASRARKALKQQLDKDGFKYERL